MSKELIIKKSNRDITIALLEDKRLIELHTDKESNKLNVGDVYLGKVKRFIPGMNASFVDIGLDKEGFLHYTDLNAQVNSMLAFVQQAQQKDKNFNNQLNGFKFLPETHKGGKITEVLKNKPLVLVQVFKEPIANKGPRLSTEISLPGRYIVLMPLLKRHISISKKITRSEENKRLMKIAKEVCPDNFNVIIRTAAENVSDKEIQTDIKNQLTIWDSICQELFGAEKVKKLYSETQKVTSVLREVLNDSFSRIVVNDRSIFDEVKSYLNKINSNQENILHFHSGGDIFETFGVQKQIKTSFGKHISLPNLSGSLVIEHTEAMHVVDVNSGFKTIGNSQEDNALKNNLAAADEIARQLRLRDMGGLIAIDFIDMKSADSRKALLKRMQELLMTQKTRHHILPISKFGVMMITRERVKPDIKINTLEICPSCQGTGKIDNPVCLEQDIVNTATFLAMHNYKNISIHVHPFIYAYFTKGILMSKLNQLRWRLKQWVNLYPDSKLQFMEYHFFDKNKEEIKIN